MIAFNINNSELSRLLGLKTINFKYNDNKAYCDYTLQCLENTYDYTISITNTDGNDNIGFLFALLIKRLIEIMFRISHDKNYRKTLLYALTKHHTKSNSVTNALNFKIQYDELCNNIFIKYIHPIPERSIMINECYKFINSNSSKDREYSSVMKNKLINIYAIDYETFINKKLFINIINKFNRLELYCLYDILTNSFK